MKKRCQAFALSGNSRCEKRALAWSRYCWWHQPKGLLAVSLILGSLLSLVLPEVYHNFLPSREEEELHKAHKLINTLRSDVANAQRHPSFLFFLNDVILPKPTTDPNEIATHSTVLLPIANGPQRLSICVRNVGNLAAEKLEVAIQFPMDEANLEKSGNWKDFPGLIKVTDEGIVSVEGMRCYTTVSQNVIPQGEVYACHDLLYTKSITSEHALRVFLSATSIRSDFHKLSVTIIFSEDVDKPTLHEETINRAHLNTVRAVSIKWSPY